MSTSIPKPISSTGIGGRIFASPLAKKIAAEKGIDLSLLKGSGPDGRIRAQDVPATTPLIQQATLPLSDSYEDISTTNIRQVIAKRLSLSKQTIPHYYLNMEIEVDEILR